MRRVIFNTTAVMHFVRASTAVRAFAFLAGLSVAGAGSGVPICLSLLTESLAPCEMHAGRDRATPSQSDSEVGTQASPTQHSGCHQNTTDVGCGAGTVCHSAGPSDPAWTNQVRPWSTVINAGVRAAGSPVASHLSPPPTPPPQA